MDGPMASLKNKVAIVGAADTEVGIVPHLSATQLYVKAAKLALDDAGLTKNDIDGLITCVSFAEPIMYHAEMIAEYMQIFPRYCMTAPSGGGTTLPAVPPSDPRAGARRARLPVSRCD